MTELQIGLKSCDCINFDATFPIYILKMWPALFCMVKSTIKFRF